MSLNNSLGGILRQPPQALVDAIRVANAVPANALSITDLIIGTPAPTAGTWREGVVSQNTAVRITATDASIYQGTTVICYDRLDLAHLADLISGFKVKVYNPVTTHDYLRALRYRYGLQIAAADIIDEPVTPTASGEYTVVLRAAAGSLGWLGQVTLTAEQGNAVLSDYLTTTDLPGLNYPVTGDGANGSALMYFYPYDFTAYKATLETYTQGKILDATDTALLAAIKAVDLGAGATAWVLDGATTTYDLAGAEVVYSGINSSSLPTNQAYKYVLGILLRADVTTPPGVFYLHYNDPFDPNAV